MTEFRMLDRTRNARAIGRSLRTYYGDAARAAAMDALYERFVSPGDLVMDVGAHVGDRVASFRRLGARVVAVEPQAALVRVLRRLYQRDPKVVMVPAAVGRRVGRTRLRLNVDNPTVSTASDDFLTAAQGAPGWEGQAWSQTVDVPMTTLDALVVEHGAPRFIKIDVEGFESEALAGLTRPPPALSFEFTLIQPTVSQAALARCVELGYRRFNAALGETQQLAHADWIDADVMSAWLAALPAQANSGDVYAALSGS